MRYLHTIVDLIHVAAKRIGSRSALSEHAGAGTTPVVSVLLLIGITLALHTGAEAAVGKIPGSFTVSATGAATYSIPIWAPPGPHGLQPNLSLVYNHRSGVGYMGIGWSLAGLSSITRCTKTIAQDGAASAITLTYNDVFCLDGQRLRLSANNTLSTYGQDSTTYQTELANFANITAHGTQGNGPAYFTVQGKNGLTYEYGNGNNSQVKGTDSATTAITWLLDKVTDRAGNFIKVFWVAPSATLSGTAVPDAIYWSPVAQGSTANQYSMQFSYTTNLPQSSPLGYIAGTPLVNQQLLTSINIRNNSGTTIKYYVFDYPTTPAPVTGGYRLDQVRECADVAQSNCAIPTNISYQDGQMGTSFTPTTVASNNDGGRPYRYDVNGDGIADLIYRNGSLWYVALGSASGYGAGKSTGVAYGGTSLFGDLLGNGRAGILKNNGTTWDYYSWNGDGAPFSQGTTNGVFDPSAFSYMLADIDGDGRADLLATYFQVLNTNVMRITAQMNQTSSTSASFAAAADAFVFRTPLVNQFTFDVSSDSQGGPTLSSGIPKGLDFDGDGRQDLLIDIIYNGRCGQPPCASGTYELISNGSTFTSYSVSLPVSNLASVWTLMDFNSDGCTDVLAGTNIYISGCNGTAPSAVSVGSATVIGVMDWDGDGRTDVLVNNNGTVGIHLSTGNGLSSTLLTTTIPYTSSLGYFTADANGDGLEDLGYISGSTIGYYPHNGAGQPPDLLTSITDGYGINYSPTYVSLLLGSYSSSTNATTYPEKDVHAPLYLVKQVSASDGIGGTFTRTFSYLGAREDLRGYGSEGFESVSISDSRPSSLVSKTTYQQKFPYTGMPLSADVFQHDGTTVVSHTSYVNQELVLNSASNNKREFPYVQSVTTEMHEVGGTRNGSLITTTSRTNTFDSYGNATNVVTRVTDSDSSSPYFNQQWTTTTATTPALPDTGPNWCLTQPMAIAVTNTAPGVPSITRTTAFNSPADYVNCRVTQIVTEPNSAYTVTKTLGYDGFGNVNSVTVTGAGMTARTTTVDWGTTGQFPVTIRDALSNSLGGSGYKTVKGYDYNLGLQTSEIVQSADGAATNAPPTSWQYDLFGRKTQETRPDGTYTTWEYFECSTISGCIVGPHAMTVSQVFHNTDGTTNTSSAVAFDQLDRELMVDKRLLANGSYNRVDTRYDNFGRVLQRSAPCPLGNSITAACPYYTTYTYDALGRVIQTQRPISAANTTLQTETVQYAGRSTTATDPYGKITTKISTVAGTLGVSQDHTGYHQNFTYDAFGSLLAVTDSLSNTLFTATYAYGAGAFQRDVTDMDLDLSTTSGQHRHYNYNALGELTSWTDAKGQSFSESYDVLSRPLTRTEPDLTTTWTWGSNAANHNIGKLSVVTANGYTETLTYDGDARLSNRSVTIPSDATYGYDFTYNATTGLLDTLTYPTSTSSYRLKLSYAYQNGFLQKVTDFNAGTIYWQANATNALGQISQETLGNGVVTNRVFDTVTGWLSSATSGLNGTAALQNESYLYDEIGNVTQRQNNNAGLSENFYYDDVYRLEHSSLNGNTNLLMTYYPDGNIKSRSDVAGSAVWTYDATHKHAVTQAGSSANTYTYDANGNAMSRKGLGITWSSYNHPVIINNSGSGETVQFAYNQNHERWSAIYSGGTGVETTYFIGDLLEKVISVGASDYRHYIYAGGTKVAIYSRTTSGINTLHYVREDHQGGVSSILNSDGTSYAKESFTAYGVRRSACTWSGPPTNGNLTKINAVTRHGYTWQTALGAMGLNDMNGRIQDAVTGRFLSADPTVPNPANTQSFNRYSYVNNNPLTFSDPTGFSYTKCADDCGGRAYRYGDPGDSPMVLWASGASTGEGFSTHSNSTDDLAAIQDYVNSFISDLQSAVSSYLNQATGASGGSTSGYTTTTITVTSSQPSAPITISQGQGNLPQVVVCLGRNCPGHSKVPLVEARYPNGVSVENARTGGPLLMPQTTSLTGNIRIGETLIRGLPPGLRGAVMATLFAPGGDMDYQRTFSDNGNVVPELIDAGYYNFGVVAAAAGYSLTDALRGAGAANQLGSGDKSGPYGTNGARISNTVSGWVDYDMGLWSVHH